VDKREHARIESLERNDLAIELLRELADPPHGKKKGKRMETKAGGMNSKRRFIGGRTRRLTGMPTEGGGNAFSK